MKWGNFINENTQKWFVMRFTNEGKLAYMKLTRDWHADHLWSMCRISQIHFAFIITRFLMFCYRVRELHKWEHIKVICGEIYEWREFKIYGSDTRLTADSLRSTCRTSPISFFGFYFLLFLHSLEVHWRHWWGE